MTTSLLLTLADYPALWLRCSGCIEELPPSARVERFGKWIVVECPKCAICTPRRLEEK